VACWDGKYACWAGRPVHVDPTLTPLLPNYARPGYPSGHATADGAAMGVLAALFPRDAALFRSRAAEDAASRAWAGIHFRSGVEARLTLGRAVGQRVAAPRGASTCRNVVCYPAPPPAWSCFGFVDDLTLGDEAPGGSPTRCPARTAPRTRPSSAPRRCGSSRPATPGSRRWPAIWG
jgi:hypothetical protein